MGLVSLLLGFKGYPFAGVEEGWQEGKEGLGRSQSEKGNLPAQDQLWLKFITGKKNFYNHGQQEGVEGAQAFNDSAGP